MADQSINPPARTPSVRAAHSVAGAEPRQGADTVGAERATPPPAGYEELLAENAQLLETTRAQAEVICALMAAADEREQQVGARLGTQHVVEQRTARLHQTERVLRSVIEALDGALCIVGADGTVLDANQRWPAPVGSDFFAWCRSTPDLHHLLTDVAAAVKDIIDADPGQAAGSSRSVKGQIGPDDARRWVVIRVHPVTDHHLVRAVITLIDITDGMRTQDQLRQATEDAQRLAWVAKATDKAVAITGPDGSIEWVNDPFVARTGYRFEEAVGHRRTDLIPTSCTRSGDVRAFLTRLERGHGADGEFALMSRTGDPYWAAIEVRPVREQGQVTHLVWVEQDITARRDTQRRLRQAITDAELSATALTREKTLLTAVISAIPQLVYWKDHRGQYAGWNTAYLAFRGLPPDVDLRTCDETTVTHDHEINAAVAALEESVITSGAPVLDRTVEIPDSHGRVRTLLLSVLPLDLADGSGQGHRGVIGVGADITHARELERQLAQANRLESIGHLAAGIAHEINTPIQFVSDNLQFVTESVTQMLDALHSIETETVTTAPDALAGVDLDFLQDEVPGALRDSREGLQRVAQIVRAMKDYAHPGRGRGAIDINRAIESTVQVCRNEWKYVAQVHLDLDPHADLVPAYEGDLKQVILNMIVNAAHAIAEDRDHHPQAGLGQITICTRRHADEFVITIADDGPGMTAAIRDRVFDPFFTTKPVGKGTGQGLSLAHAVIVTKHHGRIDLSTAPGAGATFTLHLPLTPDHPDETDTGHTDTGHTDRKPDLSPAVAGSTVPHDGAQPPDGAR